LHFQKVFAYENSFKNTKFTIVLVSQDYNLVFAAILNFLNRFFKSATRLLLSFNVVI
jgi:hypothetical protein